VVASSEKRPNGLDIADIQYEVMYLLFIISIIGGKNFV
jgi:hypothetical protein